MSYDLIILYSGGTDSRLMLKMALDEGKKPLCLFVEYGQTGRKKDEVAWGFIGPDLHERGVAHRYVDIMGLKLNFKKKYGDLVAQDYIPNRNMILISIAAAIAEQEGVQEIWLGANASDVMNYYPDCTSQWIRSINKALVVLPVGPLVYAPLEDMTQEEVIAELDDNARE